MGKRGPVATRGRRTKGEPLTLGGEYLPPPDDLRGVAREIWELTVSSLPQKHFRGADIPQLRAYCVAAAKNIKATREIEERGEVLKDPVGGKAYENPWSKIQDKSAQIMSSLATKLRITQSSMLSAKGARREWDAAQPVVGEDELTGLLFSADADIRQ